MIMFFRTPLTKTFFLFGLCVFVSYAHNAHAKINGQLFLCDESSHSWTVHESSQARMFHQEIAMSDPGTFTVTMKANGFGYMGYIYTRPSVWDKWIFTQHTDKGMRTWTRTWQIYKKEHRLGLLQLIKDSNECKNCNVTMIMTTSDCPSSNEKKTSSFETRDTGSTRCLPRIGEDGAQC